MQPLGEPVDALPLTEQMRRRCLAVYTVYERPADIPEAEYAVREWIVIGGREPVKSTWLAIAPSLDEVRQLIPPGADHCLPRNPQDDPVIVETWI